MAKSSRYQDMFERFAQALALNKSPEESARIAGYQGTGATFAANARHKANRPVVKARVAELRAPGLAKVEQQIEKNVEWVISKLAEIVDCPIDQNDIKAADIIAAARQMAAIRGWNAPTTLNVNKHVHTDWSTEELVAFITDARASLERSGEPAGILPKPDQVH
jgi:hypothetical protein